MMDNSAGWQTAGLTVNTEAYIEWTLIQNDHNELSLWHVCLNMCIQVRPKFLQCVTATCFYTAAKLEEKADVSLCV